MKLKKLSLATSKGTHVGDPFRFEAHPLQGRLVGDRRDDEISGILKPDKSAVEQKVNTRRQE